MTPVPPVTVPRGQVSGWRSVMVGLTGLALVGIGTGLTWYATVDAKSVSAVGVGGLFAVGVLLVLAGFLFITPGSLSFTKDGVVLQLVAEAVKDVKESANQGADKAVTDSTILDKVKTAQTDEEAKNAVRAVAEEITRSMPHTSELTEKALQKL